MRTNMKNLVRALTCLALPIVLIPCSAQTPPATSQSGSNSNVVRLNRAPISNDVLHVRLPKPVKVTLSNGVRVLILEDHRFPLVTVQLSIDGAGTLFDPTATPGLSSMTAGLMRQGTATRSSKQLAEEIDSLGANISVSAPAGAPDAVLRASGSSENFNQWFKLASDVLLHPSFPADELAQLKQRQLVALRQQRSNASFLASERLMKVLYGEHPASVVSGTPESIQGLTPELIAKWYHDRYTPQNSILAIAGDVRATELTAQLEQVLAEWRKTDLKITVPNGPAAATATKLYLVDRPGSVQTNLLLGNLTVDRRSADYVPLMLLNNIVGGGAAGRLFMNLREDKGYTYGAYSKLDAGPYVGPWIANSEVRSEVTGGAVDEFMNEIRRIAQQPVPDEELQRNKRAIVARFALSLERPASVIDYQLTAEKYGFPVDYWDKYPSDVMAVTAADIQRVARKYINPDAIQIVAVGDATKIKSVLEKYGTVEVSSGEPKSAAAGR